LRLLALDVDGTVLTSRGHPAPGLREAIARLPDDMRVVIATGRRLSSLYPVLGQIGLDTSTVVVLNGGLTIDLARPRVLAAHRVGTELEEAIRGGEERGLLVGAVFPTPRVGDLYGSEGLARVNAPGYAGPIRRPLKEACYVAAWGTAEAATTWADAVDRRGDVRVYAFPEGPNWYHVEVTPKGVDKQVAVSDLAHSLGVARRDVIAVGDGGNDTTLIAWAGLGVAMGNASPEAKGVADRVIGHADAGALTDFLKEFHQDAAKRGLPA